MALVSRRERGEGRGKVCPHPLRTAAILHTRRGRTRSSGKRKGEGRTPLLLIKRNFFSSYLVGGRETTFVPAGGTVSQFTAGRWKGGDSTMKGEQTISRHVKGRRRSFITLFDVHESQRPALETKGEKGGGRKQVGYLAPPNAFRKIGPDGLREERSRVTSIFRTRGRKKENTLSGKPFPNH